MATTITSEELLALLRRDVGEFNRFRGEHPEAIRFQGLTIAQFSDAQLSSHYLAGANLSCISLKGADLVNAVLDDANLTETYLDLADLRGAKLRKANLTGASLNATFLSGADLTGAVGLTPEQLAEAASAGAIGVPWLLRLRTLFALLKTWRS